MTGFRDIRRRARRMTAPILGALFVCYVVWHGFHGDYGIIAWLQLHENVAEARQRLADTGTERAFMEHRAALLSASSIDADMLDERARIMTGLADPRDYILIWNPEPFGTPPAR